MRGFCRPEDLSAGRGNFGCSGWAREWNRYVQNHEGVISEDPVLFFSAYDDKHLLQSAILAGAHGYLLKIASREALVKSIELVATGRAILDRQLTPQVLSWVRDGGWDAPHKTLQRFSTQDQKILSLVAAGRTNKEIAQEL
jgi:two-component system, NarL family, response regulator DevR